MGRQMGEKKGMRGRINHDRINQRGAGGSLGVGGEGDGLIRSCMHAWVRCGWACIKPRGSQAGEGCCGCRCSRRVLGLGALGGGSLAACNGGDADASGRAAAAGWHSSGCSGRRLASALPIVPIKLLCLDSRHRLSGRRS